MKSAIAIALLIALSGCAIGEAGTSSFVVRNVNGKYELDVKDGKEYAKRAIAFETEDGKASLSIGEVEAKAFKGQALAVKALTVLPVTNLGDILK